MPRTSFLILLALVLFSWAGPVAAQERSWSVSILADAGANFPVRTLAKNAGVLAQRPDEQVISKLEEAVLVGVGLEVDFIPTNVRLRGMYHTTTGGEITGRLAFCGDPDSPLVTGGVCENVVADATLHQFSLDFAFVRGQPGGRFRPLIFLGLGLRKYEFGGFDCPFPPDAVYQTCALVGDIWQNEGGLNPVLRFGLGLDAILGPVSFKASLLDNVSRYTGGVGEADGNATNDVTLGAGLSVKVF